jgi:phosphoglycolate phosphatase-like HAD superfamily hydrolase
MTPTDYETVVYDLDGTLVRLAVAWADVTADARDLFVSHGHPTDGDLWSMLDLADEVGLRDELESVIGDHERSGAERSSRCPRADDLPLAVPTGVCSLNCEAACRVALDRHDLAESVETVVGRDTVATRKPDPEPLLETIRRLDGDPEQSLFVGDSERDAVTAERAGVDFEYVE